METFGHESKSLTPWLTGAGARSAEGTDMGHEDAEGMAHVGVRLTAQLGANELLRLMACHARAMGKQADLERNAGP